MKLQPRYHELVFRGPYAGAIKRTYQPKKRYRRRVHGFLRRMSTRGGARVLRSRRRKGRERLA